MENFVFCAVHYNLFHATVLLVHPKKQQKNIMKKRLKYSRYRSLLRSILLIQLLELYKSFLLSNGTLVNTEYH